MDVVDGAARARERRARACDVARARTRVTSSEHSPSVPRVVIGQIVTNNDSWTHGDSFDATNVKSLAHIQPLARESAVPGAARVRFRARASRRTAHRTSSRARVRHGSSRRGMREHERGVYAGISRERIRG